MATMSIRSYMLWLCVASAVLLSLPLQGTSAAPRLDQSVLVAVDPLAPEQEVFAAYQLAAGLGLALGGADHP